MNQFVFSFLKPEDDLKNKKIAHSTRKKKDQEGLERS